MIEILTIGTELLLGTTVDTNGAWLGTRLAAAGYPVSRRATVGDHEAAISDALLAALRRTRLVICTGGLGPTPDDFTRPVVAALYGRALRLDDAWLATIEERFHRRGWRMAESNRVQAEVPEGALLLPNSRGTAPGLVLDDPDLGTTILLPGVPSEMHALVEQQVLPLLIERLGARVPVASRTVRTTGIAESEIAERLAGLEASLAPLTLAWLPTGIGEDVRVTCWGTLQGEALASALAAAEGAIVERLDPFVYGRDGEDLAAVVGGALRARGASLAIAESCTGGLLAQRITAVPGASEYFVGGVIAYADEAKRALLGVAADMIAEQGAVSEPVACALAEGARRALGTDFALSITGVAGPGGGTPAKPVGTVWIGVADGSSVEARLHRLAGDRDEIRARSAQAALALLLRRLRGSPQQRRAP